MILVGSLAAELGEFFPAWREAPARDIDLACHERELAAFATATGLLVRCVGPDKHLVPPPGAIVEITAHAAYWIELLERLCERQPVALRPGIVVDCHVATPEILWAMLEGPLRAIAAPKEKSVRDLQHYRALVERRGERRAEHWSLATYFEERVRSACS